MTIFARSTLAIVALAFLGTTGCSESEPVSYSAPIALNLKAKSDDAAGNAVRAEKGITTEVGNPYGAFVTQARKVLGVDPGRVEIASIELLLAADSKGVTALEQVFTGTVDVLFEMGDSKNTYTVGDLDDPTGSGPLAFAVSFQYADLAPQDVEPFLNGAFKVVIRGTEAAAFEAKGLEAGLQITLTFSAYE